jgi:hypothetical protein
MILQKKITGIELFIFLISEVFVPGTEGADCAEGLDTCMVS